MNSNQFTHKTEQIISNAQQIAYQNNNTNIEPAHLLISIIDVDKNVFPHICKKFGVSMQSINQALNAMLKSFATSTNNSEVRFNPKTQKILSEAIKLSLIHI